MSRLAYQFDEETQVALVVWEKQDNASKCSRCTVLTLQQNLHMDAVAASWLHCSSSSGSLSQLKPKTRICIIKNSDLLHLAEADTTALPNVGPHGGAQDKGTLLALDCMALAITQAATCIRVATPRWSVREYCEVIRRRRVYLESRIWLDSMQCRAATCIGAQASAIADQPRPVCMHA